MSVSRIGTPQHGLQFGALPLVGPLPADTPYTFRVGDVEEGFDFGNGDPVLTVVQSLLADGSLVSLDRKDNRQVSIPIMIKAPDGVSLAQGEAALAAECERQNTLVWTPPDGDDFAPPSVFVVVTSWLEFTFSGQDELNRSRRYLLHITAAPHVRSLVATTVEAIGGGVTPPAPDVEVISDASSLTGWAAINFGDAAPSLGTFGGEDYVETSDDDGKPMTLQYTHTSVLDLTGTPYLAIDYFAFAAELTFVKAGEVGSMVELPIIADGGSPLGTPWRRVLADLTPVLTAVERVELRVDHPIPELEWTSRLWIANVSATNGNAGSGTTRQLYRYIDVGGSARAQGSIHLSHDDDSLGDVLVWSGPAACLPPLRPFKISGEGATADTTTVSGSREQIETPFVVEVPHSALPAGSYALLARLRGVGSTGQRDIAVSAQTYVGGVAVGPTQYIDKTIAIGSTTDWQIEELGVLHLPVTDAPGNSDAVVRITIENNTAATNVELDEAWAFNYTDGSLTWIADQAADKNVWINAPTVEIPTVRIYTGANPDQSDAYQVDGNSIRSWGDHLLGPGPWTAFTVTTDAEDAAVSGSFYKTWLHNAAE